MTTDDLLRTYAALMQRADDGTFTRDDALSLLAVAAELGARGYVLDADGVWEKEMSDE